MPRHVTVESVSDTKTGTLYAKKKKIFLTDGLHAKYFKECFHLSFIGGTVPNGALHEFPELVTPPNLQLAR